MLGLQDQPGFISHTQHILGEGSDMLVSHTGLAWQMQASSAQVITIINKNNSVFPEPTCFRPRC